jgi:hypothetical protein
MLTWSQGKRDKAQMPYSLLQKYRQVQPEMQKIGKPCCA